jgi:Spy/CpxP family protein refolding chaperone
MAAAGAAAAIAVESKVTIMWTKLFIIGIAVSALAFAQGKKGGGGQGGGGGGMMPQTVNRMDQFNQILKLDKDEKKQLKSIMDDAQKEASPVKDQMEKGRLAVAGAVAGGKQDEIDGAVKGYAASESQMAGIEMNAFAKVYKLLDKDQQQKAPQVYAMMPGIFKGKTWTEPPAPR